MGDAAVMKFPGNFGKVEFIVNQEFFYSFYLMSQVKLFNGSSFNLGKEIGEICIIMIEFFAQVIGKVYFDLFVIIMDKFYDEGFDFLDKYLLIVVHEFQTCHSQSITQLG